MKRFVFVAVIFFLCLRLHAELFFTPDMISSHLKSYSTDEIKMIEKDLKVIRSVCLDDVKVSEDRFYLATAGAPGARKTTILERFVNDHTEYQNGAYLDPDARTLRFMVHTYYQSLSPFIISNSVKYDDIIKYAYDKWRSGSHYIVLSLLEEAFAVRNSIIFGTTSTGAHLPTFFSNLKKNNYKIVLLLCSCLDSVRYDAVNYRNSVIRFYQSSPEDALSKGLIFSERMEVYFKYADKLYFYWTDGLFGPERLCGIWSDGNLEVNDKQAMQSFIDKYEEDRKILKSKDIIIRAFDSLLGGNKNLASNR